MFGIKVNVNQWACKPEFIRWRRVHRNNRINRKWRKKYGSVVMCRGTVFQVVGVGFVVCPCANAEIQKRLVGANGEFAR